MSALILIALTGQIRSDDLTLTINTPFPIVGAVSLQSDRAVIEEQNNRLRTSLEVEGL
jgi:hypothetical protein